MTWLAPQAQAGTGSLDAVFALQGRRVARDPQAEVLHVAGPPALYVKRYRSAGKGLRRWLGRSRARAEWENLQLFERLGIPAPVLVAAGEERRRGRFLRAALVTLEVPGARDLAAIATTDPQRFSDAPWREAVAAQLAAHLRALHGAGFAHGDLNWRNVLVAGDPPRVYLLDCPAGRRWWGPLLQRRRARDLAQLDKLARHLLPRTARLRFFKRYLGHPGRLTAADRRLLRRVLAYYPPEQGWGRIARARARLGERAGA